MNVLLFLNPDSENKVSRNSVAIETVPLKPNKNPKKAKQTKPKKQAPKHSKKSKAIVKF